MITSGSLRGEAPEAPIGSQGGIRLQAILYQSPSTPMSGFAGSMRALLGKHWWCPGGKTSLSAPEKRADRVLLKYDGLRTRPLHLSARLLVFRLRRSFFSLRPVLSTRQESG